MIITERKFYTVKIANIFFIEEPVPVNVQDWDVVTYNTYRDWGDIIGFERKKCLTTTIDLRQSIDVIWKNIKRQNKRHIRRAEEVGTNITVSNNYEDYYLLQKKFFKQKNYTSPFGLNILPPQFMKKYGILFIAENKGKILGGNLYLHDENNALLISSAYQQTGNNINEKKLNINANCYLHWEAMQYFKNLDVINYDLGDLGSNEININHQLSGGDYFKRSFGGDITAGHKYMKFNSRLTKYLFSLWNSLQNHRLFPPE